MESFSTTFTALFFAFLISTSATAQSPKAEKQSPQESRTATYFDSIRSQPLLLAAFLREMPKGADLHNHLSGAIYAESFLRWAAEKNACIDVTTQTALPCNGAADVVPAQDVIANPVLYRTVVDAWSMRNWELSGQSGHDHFFDTFGKFGYAGANRTGDMLAEAITRAFRGRVSYLELMLTPDEGRVSQLGRKTGWENNFSAMRDRLIAGGLRDSLRIAMEVLDAAEKRMHDLLGCGSQSAAEDTPCAVQVRYLYQVGRGGAPEQVFAQILAGFEMAEMDSRVVGFNLVQPEDYPVPLGDFTLHMQMINFLRPLYSKAHISLHAGELAPGLVAPEDLCCHIRQSIELGHAERIGHGVDVAYEDDALGLLNTMAEQNVMVEICLTSNQVILGVSGDRHPMLLYRDRGVPLALATDDEGVSRIDLTHEFVKAAEEYGLSYTDLKKMARTSLEHAFLPGKSLWSTPNSPTLQKLAVECHGALPGQSTLSPACRAFLDLNDKARLQWQLEEAFARFEQTVSGTR